MTKKYNVVLLILITLCLKGIAFAEENETQVLFDSPKGNRTGEINEAAEVKILDEEDNWKKVEITGWIRTDESSVEGSSDNNESKVEFVDSRVQVFPNDYSRNSKPYKAHIRVFFQFRNNTDKMLTGLLYDAAFKDSFGDILFETEIKDQLKIPPGETNPMESYWYWEDNEFIGGQPYDNLQQAARADTLNIDIELKKAAFEDGTVVEY